MSSKGASSSAPTVASRGCAGAHGLALRGGGGRATIEAVEPAHFLILSGAEIREPVLVDGPFIMNERSQIETAIARFRAWGAALGFWWARLNPQRVRAIVHMEAVALPMSFSDLPEGARAFFKALRSPAGEEMVLKENIFIELVLKRATIRDLTPEEIEHYRRPFLEPGEGRRPTLSFPRNLPLDGEPPDTVTTIAESANWMERTVDLPKLFIHGAPGTLMRGRVLEAVRAWPNQTEVAARGVKLLQEDSPDDIGTAIADFIRRLGRTGQFHNGDAPGASSRTCETGYSTAGRTRYARSDARVYRSGPRLSAGMSAVCAKETAGVDVKRATV